MTDQVKDVAVETTSKDKVASALDNHVRPEPSFGTPGKMVTLAVDRIETDRGLQARAHPLNDAHVESLREAVSRGEKRIGKPVVVYHVTEKDEGGNEQELYLLADGFHWHAAHIREGKKRIEVELREGTRSDALRYALSANATHGLPRTTADKERAIYLALSDKELRNKSTLFLSKLMHLSQGFVESRRTEIEKQFGEVQTKRVDARGRKKESKLNTKRRKGQEEKDVKKSATNLVASSESVVARLSKAQKGQTDILGNPVPEGLSQVFAARIDIKGIIAVLENAKVRVQSLRNAGALAWAPKTLDGNMEAVVADLEAAIPAVVSEGHKNGFLSQGQYDALSKTEKSALEPGKAAEQTSQAA